WRLARGGKQGNQSVRRILVSEGGDDLRRNRRNSKEHHRQISPQLAWLTTRGLIMSPPRSFRRVNCSARTLLKTSWILIVPRVTGRLAGLIRQERRTSVGARIGIRM